MASSIKLTNANGKVLTLSHQDTHNEDNVVDVLSTAYTIETINDFATVPTGFKTVIVKDGNRGGTFIWSATGTANDGTVFAGATGYWSRQYSGAINAKDFGTTNNTIMLQSSINYLKSLGGGELLGDAVAFITDADVEIKGQSTLGSNFNFQNSKITFSHVGNGLTLGSYATPASEYRLRANVEDLNISGSGKLVAGTSSMKIDETANVIVNGGTLNNSEKGLWLNGGLICDFNNQIIRDNGVGIVANATTHFAPNANNFNSLKVISNDLAVTYDGNPNGCANWFATEIEGNNLSGNTTDGKSVTNLTNAGHHNFIGCHFEANNGQNSITYSGSDATKSLLMIGTELIDSLVGTAVNMVQGKFTSIANRITATTNSILFGANASGTLIDTEATISGTLSKVIGIRFGRIGYGTQPISTDPLLNATSASIISASNIVQNYDADIIQYRWRNAAGTRVGYFQTSATAQHTLNNDNASGGWVIRANNSDRLYVGRGGALNIEPGADNTMSCGSAALRWSVIYAGTGTINTSDERTKTFLNIEDAEIACAKELKKMIRKYQFNDAIALKGSNARIHYGVGAQSVVAKMSEYGLDAMKYGFICYDKWDETLEVKDEEGNIIQEYLPYGDKYGIRYEELLCFIIGAM